MDANVFNTFSFKRWSDQKKEEEIDAESRRRRTQQIKRLKEKLRRERILREQTGTGDLDIEALIEAIQNAETTGGGAAEKGKGLGDYGYGFPHPDEPDDDHILAELRKYAAYNYGQNGNGATGGPGAGKYAVVEGPPSFQYNRKYALYNPAQAQGQQLPPAPKFQYNRYVTNN